jgi:plastocyanin
MTLAGCGGGKEKDFDTDEKVATADSAQSGSVSSAGGYQTVAVTNGGKITGKVIYNGAPPALPDFDITADKEACATAAHNNRLQVGSGNGVEYAVVYLENVKQGKPMPLDSGLTIDQRGCQYTPHVLAAPIGAKVTFLNSDQVPHNVRVEEPETEKIVLNRAQPAQGMKDGMEVKNRGPFAVGCDYHPWMNAYVFGVDNPYYAVTGADGAFAIDGIPPGTYAVTMWLNGITTLPKRDNQGKLVRYGFSEPIVEHRQVTVAAGGSSDLTFDVTPKHQ